MAVAKLIIGVAGLGLVGVGYSGVAGQDNSTRDSNGTVVEGGEVGALRIRVGDCFGDVPGSTFEAVDAIPCTESHMYEAFSAFNMSADSAAVFPGRASIKELADNGCIDRFAEFVGIAIEYSVYGVSTITPTEGSWDELDDREVLCLIRNYDDTWKQGTARNSGL